MKFVSQSVDVSETLEVPAKNIKAKVNNEMNIEIYFINYSFYVVSQ